MPEFAYADVAMRWSISGQLRFYQLASGELGVVVAKMSTA